MLRIQMHSLHHRPPCQPELSTTRVFRFECPPPATLAKPSASEEVHPPASLLSHMRHVLSVRPDYPPCEKLPLPPVRSLRSESADRSPTQRPHLHQTALSRCHPPARGQSMRATRTQPASLLRSHRPSNLRLPKLSRWPPHVSVKPPVPLQPYRPLRSL